MSANTVAKYIRQLEEKRLIDTEPTKVRTKTGEVRNGTLRFTICPIQEAVNYKLKRDLAALSEQRCTKKSGENQTRPCAAISGRSGDEVGNGHQRSPRQALLKPCEPTVEEQGKPKKDDIQPLPRRGRGKGS